MRDGFLHVRQGKTAQKLRTEITGELAQVLDRIRPGRPDTAPTTRW